MCCHPRFEGPQARRRHQHHQADVLELGVSPHRMHRSGPPVEARRARVRVAADERARADDEVFLVLDRQLQGRGDLGRGQMRGEPPPLRIGVGHRPCPEHGRKHPRKHQDDGDHHPHAPTTTNHRHHTIQSADTRPGPPRRCRLRDGGRLTGLGVRHAVSSSYGQLVAIAEGLLTRFRPIGRSRSRPLGTYRQTARGKLRFSS